MRQVRSVLNSYRVRLVLAFVLVVSVALALVFASLPRLLDGYFVQQDQQNLDSRAEALANIVSTQLTLYQTLEPDVVRAILLPGPDGEPPRPSETIYAALGTPTSGVVATLTPRIALADVRVDIYATPGDSKPVYSLSVPVEPSAGRQGQTREPMTSVQGFTILDRWWTQQPLGAPERLVTVTLTDPFTYRTQTIETIASVMFTAALIALMVGVVAAILLAQWLTNPIRRLTLASRALAEGQLDARVSIPESGTPEVAELALAFNNMADRLQQSIDIISTDRDRSREFLADVSHELRTPIAALRTFNELLLDGAAADPRTREEFLDQSGLQIERLDWLATNLLELSKLDSGLVSLDLRPDDLRAVVENAVQQAHPGAARKGVELVMHLPSEPVRQLHDPPRIGQVLSNLIGNAIKFTPAGGRVDVELTATPEGAELMVTDTGVGIDPAELPHVFERFYRGTETPEMRAAGSGLGLSIAKSIVDMHEGRIEVTSAPGTGTKVVVSLPRDISVSSPAPARP